MAKFMGQNFDINCAICGKEKEDIDHLFFGCSWATEFWQTIKTWWPSTIVTTDIDSMPHLLQKLDGPRRDK